jgi:hypothetical protein
VYCHFRTGGHPARALQFLKNVNNSKTQKLVESKSSIIVNNEPCVVYKILATGVPLKETSLSCSLGFLKFLYDSFPLMEMGQNCMVPPAVNTETASSPTQSVQGEPLIPEFNGAKPDH